MDCELVHGERTWFVRSALVGESAGFLKYMPIVFGILLCLRRLSIEDLVGSAFKSNKEKVHKTTTPIVV